MNSNNPKSIELKDIYAILTDIRDAIKDSSKWAKFAGMKEVKPVLESQLDDDAKKIIYTLSDGKNSSYEIEKIVKTLSQRTISNYWDKWEKAGIGEPYTSSGKGSRFKASFNLEDFGIKVPELSKKLIETSQTNQPMMEAELNDK